MHGDRTLTGNTKDGGGQRGSRWRIAAWVAAAVALLVPLVAGADWSAGDFAFAAVLLFGSLGAYELAARRTGNPAYRAGVGVALAAAFLLVWATGAVGITDSAADGWYLGVLAVGVVGALVARFGARGMARAMFATALAQAAVTAGALLAGMVPAFNSAFEILGINAVFVALFAGAGRLFQKAAVGRGAA